MGNDGFDEGQRLTSELGAVPPHSAANDEFDGKGMSMRSTRHAIPHERVVVRSRRLTDGLINGIIAIITTYANFTAARSFGLTLSLSTSAMMRSAMWRRSLLMVEWFTGLSKDHAMILISSNVTSER